MSPVSLEQRAEKRLGSMLRERYRLVSVLGIGGMATVYLAQHRNGNRVALKMLHAELSVEEDLRARFVREGYVANAIEHPGTVRVLDDDVAEDGSAFLVMELLEGATVYDRARALGGTLSIEEATWLGWHVLDVLAAAHDKGIIHRDVKPENLFVTEQGALKVLDFGIARVRDGSSSAPTRTGRAMGTPAFMPPEQALGRQSEIDPRTDVWAVGATLFSLLSGQLVHVATTPEEHVVYAATQLARPLISVAPDVPVPLAIVVDRALAFAKDGRWESARAMQSALAAAHKAMFGIPVLQAAPPAPIAAAPAAMPIERPSSGDLTVHAPPPQVMRDTAMADTARAPSPRPAPPATPTVRSPGTPAQEPARWPTDATASLSAARLPASTSPGAPAGPPETPEADTPKRPSPPPAAAKRSWLPAAAMMVVAAGLGFLATRRTLGPPAPVASASASTTTGCASNAACADGSICRRARAPGACVPLEAGRCRAIADDATRRSDDTVWIGVMFPQTGPDAALYGMGSVRAVELGRRDFVDIANGFPRTTGPARPIGLLVCDDTDDPTSSADHLARVGVPAIIGFSRSKEVLDLAASHFNPFGILALASNQAPMLAGIPRAPTGERMVFRTTTSATMVVEPTALFITQELAKDVEAASAGRKEPLRVALLRPQNATGLGYAEAFVRSLRIDGRPLAERPDSFRQLVRPDAPPTPADLRAAVDELLSYTPHVIMDDYWNGPGLIEAVEAAWPKGRPRPRWLWGALSEEDVAALHAKGDLGKRLFRIDTPASTSAHARYVLRHNEVFPDKVTARTATDAPYDAFYALAYAILSLGDAEPTGTALARAMARIVPPGTPIEVGPGGIFDALSVLRRGQNVDLIGTTTSLDFDRETGDPTADFVVYGATERGSAETGLTFSAKTRTLSGKRAERRLAPRGPSFASLRASARVQRNDHGLLRAGIRLAFDPVAPGAHASAPRRASARAIRAFLTGRAVARLADVGRVQRAPLRRCEAQPLVQAARPRPEAPALAEGAVVHVAQRPAHDAHRARRAEIAGARRLAGSRERRALGRGERELAAVADGTGAAAQPDVVAVFALHDPHARGAVGRRALGARGHVGAAAGSAFPRTTRSRSACSRSARATAPSACARSTGSRARTACSRSRSACARSAGSRSACSRSARLAATGLTSARLACLSGGSG